MKFRVYHHPICSSLKRNMHGVVWLHRCAAWPTQRTGWLQERTIASSWTTRSGGFMLTTMKTRTVLGKLPFSFMNTPERREYMDGNAQQRQHGRASPEPEADEKC